MADAIGEVIFQGNFSRISRVQQGVKKQYINIVFGTKEKSLNERKMDAEMKFLNLACHPNIVKQVGTPEPIESDNEQKSLEPRQCVYLEYMDLGSLDKVLKKLNSANPPLDSLVRCNLAKAIAVQCLSGLAFIHLKMNRLHRDIKPGNILLNKEGRVKLCDFDCMFDRNYGEPNTETGTNEYLAPEVPEAGLFDTFYTNKADMWSIGVTLYEVATGTIFNKNQLEEHFPKDLAKVSDEDLRGLLKNLLQKDPTVRLDALSAFYHPALRDYTFFTKEESEEKINRLAKSRLNVDLFRHEALVASNENRKSMEVSLLCSWGTLDGTRRPLVDGKRVNPDPVLTEDGTPVTSDEKNYAAAVLKGFLLNRQVPSVEHLKNFFEKIQIPVFTP